MKKFLCLLVALLFIGSFVLAESIDLSSMTDDELTRLKEKIADEIERRNSNASSIRPWYDFGLGQYLPSFADATGNTSTKQGISWNNETSFAEQFEGASENDFKVYCEALEEWGYNKNKSTTWASYEASNSDGIKVSLYIISDQITLQADKR